MEWIPSHPAPQSPARVSRRFGRTFSRVDHLANTSLCLHNIGKVQIDCQFRLSQSRWGVLGDNRNPAGILYMDLKFIQPKECQLTTATVFVTLEEEIPETEEKNKRQRARTIVIDDREDLRHSGKRPHNRQFSGQTGYQRAGDESTKDLRKSGPQSKGKGIEEVRIQRHEGPVKNNKEETEKTGREPVFDSINTDVMVESNQMARCLQITDHYGPKQLGGPPKSLSTTQTLHLTPQLYVLGNGGGGVGYDRERDLTHISQWTFRGHLLPAKQSEHYNTTRSRIHRSRITGINRTPKPTIYRTLRWELTENDLESTSMHSSSIHTAFTFEHDNKPFYIRVEIQGKLQKKSDRLKGKIKGLMKFPSGVNQDEGTSVTLVNPDRTSEFTQRLDQIAQGLSRDMERLNMEEIRVQIADSLPVSFRGLLPDPPITASNDSSDPSTTTVDNPPLITTSDPSTRQITSPPAPLLGIPTVAKDRQPDPQVMNSLHPVNARMSEIQQERIEPSVASPSTPAVAYPPTETMSKTVELDDMQQIFRQLAEFPALLLFLQWVVNFLGLFPRKSGTVREVSSEKTMRITDKGDTAMPMLTKQDAEVLTKESRPRHGESRQVVDISCR